MIKFIECIPLKDTKDTVRVFVEEEGKKTFFDISHSHILSDVLHDTSQRLRFKADPYTEVPENKVGIRVHKGYLEVRIANVLIYRENHITTGKPLLNSLLEAYIDNGQKHLKASDEK